MEDMPRLPHIIFLSLNVEAKGHSFGASIFHVLRMCAGVRKLDLVFDVTTEQLEVMLHPYRLHLVVGVDKIKNNNKN